jgi:hypothetical protein
MARLTSPAIMMVAVLALAPCLAAAAADNSEGPAKGRENQPPVLTVNIPLQNFPEDNQGNKGYHLVNLSKYFNDDHDWENLTYSVVFATDPTHICATVDGQFLSFTTPTPDWYGQEKFRVRATDSEGVYAESNNFTVRVTPVSDLLHIHPLPVLEVVEGWESFFDITPYLDSDYDRPEDVTISTNVSFVRVEGRILFITVPWDMVVDTFQIIANGSMNQARTDLKLVVWRSDETRWALDRTVHFYFDIFMTEDRVYLENLSQWQPLNPEVYWNITDVRAGTPPMFEVTLINSSTMRISPGLHLYGRGGEISAMATVPNGLKFNYHFSVTVFAAPAFDRLTRINDTIVFEHQHVSFRLIKENRWEDLEFWTNSSIFNITRDGWVNFTPDQKDVGRWHIYYCVSLWGQYPDQLEFNLTVLNVNDPPENATILKPQDGKRLRSGERIEFEGNATDADGDFLNYTWYSDGIPFASGKSFRLYEMPPGRHRIFVKVSDGEYSIPSQTIGMTVEPTSTVVGGSIPLAVGFLLGALAVGICALLFLRRKRS